MSRFSSVLILAQLVAAMVLTVLVQAWLLPSEVRSTVAMFPEVRTLAVPGIIWGVAAIACLQGVGIVGMRIVALLRKADVSTSTNQASFCHARVYTWLWAVVGCLLALLTLVLVAYTALAVLGFSTPAMPALIIVGVGTTGAAAALALFLGTRPDARGGARPGYTLEHRRVDASHRPA